MTPEMLAKKLEKELDRALDGMDPWQKALMLVEAIREVYGGKWVIEAKADGGFNFSRQSPRLSNQNKD